MGDRRKGQRARRASSDMDESNGEEDDRLEQMLSQHQQRNVADWGQGNSASNGADRMSRNARRDVKRDERRTQRRDWPGNSRHLDPDQSFEMDTKGVESPFRPTSLAQTSTTTPSSAKRVNGLLLPEHVDINSEDGMEEEGEDEIGKQGQGAEDENAQGELGDFVRLDADKSGVRRVWPEVRIPSILTCRFFMFYSNRHDIGSLMNKSKERLSKSVQHAAKRDTTRSHALMCW
jgi:hypothetical protein